MTGKILKNISFCFFAVSFFIAISNVSYANAKRMRCNVNSECRPGFVCVGGMGEYVDTGNKQGCCEIILPIRQVCLFHNLIAGKFGRGIVALVVISMGLAVIFGKLGFRSLVTFFAGTVCIFGSYQVVYLLTGYKYQMCELVDTSTPPGECGDEYNYEILSNAYNEKE